MTTAASTSTVSSPPSHEQRRAYIEAAAPRVSDAFAWGVFVDMPYVGAVFLERRVTAPWTSWRDFFALHPDGLYDFSVWAGSCEFQFSMPGTRPSNALAEMRSVRGVWWLLGVPLLAVALAGAVLLRLLSTHLGWRMKRLGFRLAWALWPAAMDRQLVLDAERKAWRERKGAEALALLAAQDT